jgi:N-methylhydantoinase B
MEQVPLKNGDVFVHIGASGGGFGDALERDVGRVLRDIVEGKETVEYALDIYGVVVDDCVMQVDPKATSVLRERMRASCRLGRDEQEQGHLQSEQDGIENV